MNINEEIKSKRQLPQYVNEHLMFLVVDHIKYLVFGFTFVFLDLFIIVPLLYPFIIEYLFFTVPFLLFIHIWAIRLLCKNPFSIQFESILFIGSIGVVGSYVFMLLAQKMAYHYVGITETSYYVFTTIIYLIIAVILVFYQIRKYAIIKKKTKEGKGRSIAQYTSIAAIAPAIGYILAQNVIKKSEILMHMTLIIIFYSFSIFFAYIAAKYFHKFYFMKANMHFVTFQKPSKKEMKKLLKRGKEIVIK